MNGMAHLSYNVYGVHLAQILMGSEFLVLNLKSKTFGDNLVLGFIANIHIH